MTEKKKAGRPPSRSFPLGEFTVTVTGPRDVPLKFESRDNYIQIAVGDGELREKFPPAAAAPHLPSDPSELREIKDALRNLAARGPIGDSIPSVGEGTDHILSDAGLKGPIDEVQTHLKAVTDSVGGY